MSTATDTIEQLATQEYKYGFETLVDADTFPPGLNEDVVRAISPKKDEPEWMLEWRLKAFRRWLTMTEPTWPNVHYPSPKFQDISYYSAPKNRRSWPASTRSIRRSARRSRSSASRSTSRSASPASPSTRSSTRSRSRRPSRRSSASSASSSARSPKRCESTPSWCSKYLGSVVPYTDNFYAALNSAVFTDGSFVYIPKGVRCPMELSTYFRINAKDTGQFERTLIIADEGAYVSYLEGCTAPMRDENQLHAAVVELVALDGATIKYSTVQNWYPGDKDGKGGIYNFVTKRGKAMKDAKITWTQVETGSAITWKYPSCILQGDNSVGEFYSVAVANNQQQADTGTKMIHIGKNTRSTIVSKGISAGVGQNTLSRRW